MVGKFAFERKNMQTKKGISFSLLTFSFKEGSKCLISRSLRGRRSKGKGKGIRARDHARGRREEVSFVSPSRAPRGFARPNSPFPF